MENVRFIKLIEEQNFVMQLQILIVLMKKLNVLPQMCDILNQMALLKLSIKNFK